jgi:uncharacterized protein DUF2844
MKIVMPRVAFLLLLLSFRAHASLGGGTDSIDADRAAIKGTVQPRQGAGYSVHEIHGATGTVVREYVSPGGTVFAVGWQGQFTPDLQQLLGPYFDMYVAGVKAQKASYIGRRPLTLKLPGLVVERRGHLRAESGRAYIPEQVPPGVKVEELW